ncbi:uncharacterized protein MYCFIDRAFT_41188 [Pseudocercospora fijiensis CIRAD86]|uniref:Large ribosomal subunit protein mL38 n=1 Tax=Pseudocercospora fijiensis (strain CIRAD86) TaxID=383855 RepID=M3B8U0_PSEFD|nr:uncharacterized protein MYCFIDRAFT_41188 [Pseudocercospora fijiensis CIRAD86]EME85742.1 hypothetical protein MYCFIDRAFT_41188 [Pseudocercospora fijiensis CIRAD86]
MALDRSARPLAQCLRCTRHERIAILIRSFSTSTNLQDAETAQVEKPARVLDPLTVSTPRLERKMIREQKQMPIASRRRRRAIASSSNIPFEQLPYQCFQEARAFLQEDRAEKLEMIKKFRARIENLMDTVPVTQADIERKEARLRDMRKRLEDTKILADINDPLVKKKFEDGFGDMSKPIYRHLAQKKWRSYERELLMQRITQMNVIPDVLDEIDPTVSVELSFSSPANPLKSRKVHHGDLVDSRVSEHPPNLNIQPFEKGEKLVTIAVVNPDVPNVEKDAFDYRCHFLACNVPVSATRTYVELGKLSEESQIVIPWLPAYSQSGLPYQRMAIFVLEQPPASAVAFSMRKDFILRDLRDTFDLKPVGVDLFRTVWDDGTAGVMQRAGIVGWDVEFKRKRVEPLPYKRLKEERFR